MVQLWKIEQILVDPEEINDWVVELEAESFISGKNERIEKRNERKNLNLIDLHIKNQKCLPYLFGQGALILESYYSLS